MERSAVDAVKAKTANRKFEIILLDGRSRSTHGKLDPSKRKQFYYRFAEKLKPQGCQLKSSLSFLVTPAQNKTFTSWRAYVSGSRIGRFSTPGPTESSTAIFDKVAFDLQRRRTCVVVLHTEGHPTTGEIHAI
jgi:hypothetical protein